MDEPVLKTVWDADVPASRFRFEAFGRARQRAAR